MSHQASRSRRRESNEPGRSRSAQVLMFMNHFPFTGPRADLTRGLDRGPDLKPNSRVRAIFTTLRNKAAIPQAEQGRPSMRRKLGWLALRTASLYGLVGALWIVLSDRLLVALISDPRTVNRLQTYKGWAFVSVTAVLLYVTLRRQLKRWNGKPWRASSPKRRCAKTNCGSQVSWTRRWTRSSV